LSRRRVLGAATAGAVGTALGASRARSAFAQETLAGEVEFWRLSGAGFQGGVLDEAAGRLEAAHPEVTVTIQELQNDPFKTKLAVAMGGDNPPDVWHTWGGGVLAEYVNAGGVLDITDELAKDGWGARFAPAVLDLMKVGDRHYGVPVSASGVFFWYNTELFAQHELTPPASWDELMTVIGTLKEQGLVPITLGNKTKWPGAFYLNYLVERIAGEDYLARVIAGEASFEDPAFVEVGRRLQELVEAGAFQPGFNGVDWDTGGSRQLLYAGKAAMELMGNWLPPIAAGESPGFEAKLDFFPVPPLPDGAGDPTSIVGGAGLGYAASQKSQAPAAAVELLRFITDDVVRDAFAENGEVPAMAGATLADPRAAKVAEALAAAKHLQLYWDQFLPPALGQAQLDITQGLLGMDLTPEEAAKQMAEIAKEAMAG
jgi:raffinose/stachyose/melibiose transport system substrate-binding protein